MPNNWKKYKLIDVINLIGGGTPKTSVKEYWDGDIPWLSVVDFNNGQKRVYDTEKKITELGLKNSSTKILKKGQLIISARGTVGVLSELGRDMSFNQSCYGLDAKKEFTTNDFLYYLVEHNIKQIKSNAYGAKKSPSLLLALFLPNLRIEGEALLTLVSKGRSGSTLGFHDNLPLLLFSNSIVASSLSS